MTIRAKEKAIGSARVASNPARVMCPYLWLFSGLLFIMTAITLSMVLRKQNMYALLPEKLLSL